MINSIKKPRAYLCHPVLDGGVESNLSAAATWIRFLIAHTTWAVGAPWFAYVTAFVDTGTYGAQSRERGLADDLVQIEGHDFLIVVNNRRSSGMNLEIDRGVELQKQVIDITGLGYELPPTKPAEIERLLAILRGILVGGPWEGTVSSTSPLAVTP